MPKAREVVSLTPDAVERAHSAAKELAASKRKRPEKKPTVSRRQVNPLVWEKALELADGQPRRIRVESETCVVVENRPH